MSVIKKMLQERTTWDGVVLVTVCGAFLLLGGLAEIAAWAGLIYGAWTIWKTEDE